MNLLPDLNCFYDPNCVSTNVKYTLPKVEAQHAIKVLRLKQNDELLISNGKGTIFKCVVVDVTRSEMVYSAIEKIVDLLASPFKNSIACGVLSSSQRMEWMVEKLVEIGLDKIYFFRNKRSQKKNVNLDRLNKTAISALKQSRKAFLPKIEIVELEELANSTISNRFVAICDENEYPHLASNLNLKANLMVIGPEGDFDQTEIDFLLNNDFKPCSLGNERLRSETAAIYALTCLKQKQ